MPSAYNFMKIYLGSDHRGYKLKDKIRNWLISESYSVEDMGAYELNPNDDYTEFAQKVAVKVQEDKTALGILFCGSGVGVDIVANKFDGVRASIGINPEQVKAGRTDDDMNVLIIASDFIKKDEAKSMIKVFLETEYESLERRERRLEEIKNIEENN